MSLTEEQIKTLKAQLSEQIQHLSPDKKAEAQKQIDSMPPEALESMLKQQTSQSQTSQQIFRSIISGEIPSKKLDENKEAIAVLSTKSISKGHTIIIPKKPVKDAKELSTSVFNLAKKIAKRISSKLHSTNVQIQTEFTFGEIIIHVIPIYDKPLGIDSPRHDAKDEDLQDLYNKLKKTEKIETIKLKRKPSKSKVIKLKRRVP